MQKWIISAVISFLVRQIGKYGEGLDWDKVKSDVHARIDDLAPKSLSGLFYDIADNVLDVFKDAISKPDDLVSIAQSAASGDFSGSCNRIIDLIAAAHPDSCAALSGLKSLLDDDKKPDEPTT
jgi:hypothetical protein